jgi:hypothetical protein
MRSFSDGIAGWTGLKFNPVNPVILSNKRCGEAALVFSLSENLA